jgi:hypothetical protein
MNGGTALRADGCSGLAGKEFLFDGLCNGVFNGILAFSSINSALNLRRKSDHKSAREPVAAVCDFAPLMPHSRGF